MNMPTEHQRRMQLEKAEWYRNIAKQLGDKLKPQSKQIVELLNKAKRIEATLAKHNEKSV